MKHYETLPANLSADIKGLSKKHNLSLWNKLQKEENKTVFYSLLIEAHFGLFFEKTCSKLRYNHKIFPNSNTTPDFVITQNGQDIIVDVCRLNPAAEDQRKHEMRDLAIQEFRKHNPGVHVLTETQSITMKPGKLCGNNGSIVNKANKYGKLVEKENMPFLICLYFDFTSGHDALDLYHCLYGHSVEFIGQINYKEFNIGATYFDLKEALFYFNEEMKKNVSGVLLRTNANEYIYFHNFTSKNRLNIENVNWLAPIQCEEGDTRR